MIKLSSNLRNRGQTLVEVLAALVIIVISVIALIRFQNYLAYDNSLSLQRSDAMLIAQSKMESLRDFDVLNPTPGYTDYQAISSGSSTSAGTTTSYTLTWTVTTNTAPDYKTITVTVSWTDRRNTNQSVVLVSHVAGIQPSNSAGIM